MSEIPVTFQCEGKSLIGILHGQMPDPSIGMVLVVGGPQYRVGSHRQFLLMARHLAKEGIAVLRFDCRGMGDSEGEFPGFEAIGPEIAAAVDFLSQQMPALKKIALWGLCDAASAICFYAAQDPRITGIAMLNPWVRSETGYARTQLKHYYMTRLIQRDFLQKVLTGKFELRASLHSLGTNIGNALRRQSPASTISVDAKATAAPSAPLADRMVGALAGFSGKILLIMSGHDLTAREFDGAVKNSRKWRRILSAERSCRQDLHEADHTFSRRAWRDQVAEWTANWLQDLPAGKI